MVRKVYRSMQGKLVDMELLGQQHELTPAIGNHLVNARGDELGPGGKIIRKREEVLAEYYEQNPNAVQDEKFVKAKESSELKGPAVAESNDVKKTNTRGRRNENQTDS